MDAGHLLTNRDFQRVGDAVRRVEGTYNIAGESAEQRGGSNVQVLQIQAGAANDFGYPARIQKWSNSAGTWSDLSATEVRVERANSGLLESTQYVLGRFLGINASNIGCFATGDPRPIAGPIIESFHTPSVPLVNGSWVTMTTITLTEAGLWLVHIDAAGDGSLLSGTTGVNGYAWILGDLIGDGGSTIYGIGDMYVADPLETGATYPVLIGSSSQSFHVLVTAATSTLTYKMRMQHGSGCTTLAPNGSGALSAIRVADAGFYDLATATIGVTPITGGTSGNILYNNAGALGGATGTRIVSDALEVKIASDRWVAFSKGSF